jgi:peptidoglycan/LPS O-acetylase OafA/YrhL
VTVSKANTAVPAKHAATLKYRPDIDGLRAVAVLAVVAFHAFPDWLPGGFIGVDIFFVISGYLISSIIFEQVKGGNFSIANFYARRIKRIFPALIIILLFCAGVGWLILFPHEYKQLGKHIAAGAGFSSNFILWREAGYFDVSAESKPLLHLWSLGIEEQFYFVWPAAIYLCWKWRLNMWWVMLTFLVASFAINIAFLDSKPVATFYLPFTRFWELLIGAVLAHIGQRQASGSGTGPAEGSSVRAALSRLMSEGSHANLRATVGVALIVASLALLNPHVAFPGWWALLPAIGAYLVISAGSKAWINRNILAHRVLVWFGLISFPLYLWHWPPLAFAHIVESARPGVATRLAAIAASIFLAWLTFELVEKRLRFRGGAERPLFAACFGVLLLGAAAWFGFLDPRHNSREIKAVAEAIADWEFPPPSFNRLEYDGHRFYSAKGAAGKGVLYTGDSGVQQYAPRIEYLMSKAPQTTKSATFATTGGCPPIPGVSRDRVNTCQDSLAAAYRLAKTDEFGTVVIGACWYCYLYADVDPESTNDYYLAKEGKRQYLKTNAGADQAIEAFADFVKSIAAYKKVFVVLSSPVGDAINPRNLLNGTRFTGFESRRSAGLSHSEFDAKFGAINERLRRAAIDAGAIIIDPMIDMCKDGVCSALTEDGSPIYSDGVHIRTSHVRKSASFIDVTMY